MKRFAIYTALVLAGLAAAQCSNEKRMQIKTKPYPQTAKTDVSDDYHGKVVADPYRWLEDDNSTETAAWVAAENEVTFDYLSQIPFRQAIEKRLTSLWNYEKIGAPQKVGDRYFYFRNDGLQNQSVLYVMNSLDDPEPKVFLDPNTIKEDGTAALASVSFSEDGKYMAYGVSQAGSDWVEIYTKEIETGRVLDEVMQWVKLSGANWAPDSKGFYYSGYDKPEGSVLSGQNQFQKVYYHALGTPQSADMLLYSDSQNPLRYNQGFQDNKEDKWFFVRVSEGTSGTELLAKHKDKKEPFRVMLKGFKYDHNLLKVKGDTAYVYTNFNAPNYRLTKINLPYRPEAMMDVIPEDKKKILQNVSFVGNNIIATYMKDATSEVQQFDNKGNLIRNIELPGIGTATGFEGDDDSTETFYTFSSFIAPPAVYRLDLATGKSTLFAEPKVGFNPDDYVTEQVFFESKDGTEVPMFLSYKKGLKLNGKNPTYLYGYGGFNVSLTPGFNPNNIAIMEQGGIYACVSLRGGGEYGEKWHKAGMLDKKQNVFDDFISAAEYLVKKKYTSKDKLAISGGSNGGLLVGACMTQRPDLFAVALPQVGVMDMLRFHLFTVGWGWVVEYGSSADAEQFDFLYKYSPLHNIKDGACYPATLITTADHDDRVVPAHSFKFAARLQEAQSCDNPVLIRIDTNAGHGAGKPTSKRIAEATDMLSFFFWNTGSNYVTE